jgi:hypothetical protein
MVPVASTPLVFAVATPLLEMVTMVGLSDDQGTVLVTSWLESSA